MCYLSCRFYSSVLEARSEVEGAVAEKISVFSIALLSGQYALGFLQCRYWRGAQTWKGLETSTRVVGSGWMLVILTGT